jgi:hypothetical protein
LRRIVAAKYAVRNVISLAVREYIDEFRRKVGARHVRGHVKYDANRAGDLRVLCQRFGGVNQYVASLLDLFLVIEMPGGLAEAAYLLFA